MIRLLVALSIFALIAPAMATVAVGGGGGGLGGGGGGGGDKPPNPHIVPPRLRFFNRMAKPALGSIHFGASNRLLSMILRTVAAMNNIQLWFDNPRTRPQDFDRSGNQLFTDVDFWYICTTCSRGFPHKFETNGMLTSDCKSWGEEVAKWNDWPSDQPYYDLFLDYHHNNFVNNPGNEKYLENAFYHRICSACKYIDKRKNNDVSVS